MAGRPIKRAIPLSVKALADEQNMTELAAIERARAQWCKDQLNSIVIHT